VSIISQWLTTRWHLPNVLPSDFGLNNRNDSSILEQSDTSVFRVFLGNKSVEVQILSQKRGELFFLKTTVLGPSYSWINLDCKVMLHKSHPHCKMSLFRHL